VPVATRLTIRKATNGDKPFIPYLGLWLKDMTFVEDGNGNYDAQGKPNLSKIMQYGVAACKRISLRLMCLQVR
jgi:hypothetical protein